jgi:type II secretory pathway component PulM
LQQFAHQKRLAVAEISLAVTKGVLEYTKAGRENERQIAYTSPSADIAPRLAQVTTRNRMTLRLGGLVSLVVGDRGAIWRAHSEQNATDFEALFALLARHPSETMRFLCELS